MQDEQQNETKLNNGRQILQYIKELRSKYESKPETIVEKEEFSFLDHLNKLIQLILNDDQFSIYSALEPERLKKWNNQNKLSKLLRFFKFNPKQIFYFLFLISITGFLVSEAVVFYADGGDATYKTYFKAILTEIAFIFLSGFKASDLIEKIWVNTLRFGVFLLMLFVISSQTILSGTIHSTGSDSIQEQVIILEKQIQEKEKTIAFYIEKGWGTTAKKLTAEKDEMVKKLLELKEKQLQGFNEKVSQIVVYKSYGQAFFRVLLLFISVLITRRLFIF